MAGPGEGAVDAGVGDGMAGEAGLRIGLGGLAPLSMLATVLLPAPAPPTTATCSGTGGWSSSSGPMQLRTRPAARRSWPAAGLVGLLAAVLLQPAEIVGQLARQCPGGKVAHDRRSAFLWYACPLPAFGKVPGDDFTASA